jgi:hypothetical protein
VGIARCAGHSGANDCDRWSSFEVSFWTFLSPRARLKISPGTAANEVWACRPKAQWFSIEHARVKLPAPPIWGSRTWYASPDGKPGGRAFASSLFSFLMSGFRIPV